MAILQITKEQALKYYPLTNDWIILESGIYYVSTKPSKQYIDDNHGKPITYTVEVTLMV